MGEEITKDKFAPEDFVQFDQRLRQETELLGDMLASRRVSESGFTLGFEVEAWLVDHGFFPCSINEEFLNRLGDPMVVPELSRFNVELNCTPKPLKGSAFRKAAAEFAALWERANTLAHTLDAHMVMTGTLPTIRETDLTVANMSPLKRYYALNNEVLRQRGGRPLKIDIAGHEHLVVERMDVMLEAAATSFQIHLKLPAALAHRYFNASIMISGPLLAAATNAPYLFGKSLWEETRIPLFEQAVELGSSDPGKRRVSFGSGYAEHTLFDLFRENLHDYPALLPLLFDQPPEELRHLRLHNGTIWRWNRPLIGFEADGTPHFRLEQRVLPAGPTFLDMMANAALHIGLVHHFVSHGLDETLDLPFEDARSNFYRAAREGLEATLQWPGAGALKAETLLLDELIPAARSGLIAAGIDIEEADILIGILTARVRSGQTGSSWQRACRSKNEGDFFRLMASYCERQRSGVPVHEWTI